VEAAWKPKTLEAVLLAYHNATINDPAFLDPLRGVIFEDNGKLDLI
jgi:hypothetical protein